ncbi:hypothetical protein REBECCA_264 [Erwinia phage Rebecca]|uniref:Uncharacterized protein n=1 Tax=Erwinia phage Rebecca TaxID=2530026 RepID=A0A482IJP2_9CAUD|nr:hypothetical protein REBECCA_264 [Erwinia phage Rebecca]
MTPTKQIKRSYRLIKVTADVTRDNWVGKDIDFIVQPNKDMIDDTTRGGPNRLLATYIVLGNRIPVTVNSHATITREEGLQDLQVSIVDGQSNYIDISNVRYVVSCELEEHFTYTPPKEPSLLDQLVGGPMGDPAHMFIIDENYNVFVGTANDSQEDYTLAGRLISNLGSHDAEANDLEIIGSYPDDQGDHYYVSIDWNKSFISGISNNEKCAWFNQLDALVAMLLEKIKVTV